MLALLKISPRYALLLAGLSLLLVAGYWADSRASIQSTWAAYPVLAPDSVPEPSQEGLDLALVLFGIEIPDNVAHPVYDPLVQDRGLTIRRGWFSRASVTIGPSAFSSWALLGSTLAHELEVHCRQNFMMISLMDKLGLDGTGTAEREAYLHELRFAARFGMDNYDHRLISETMNYYYPPLSKETDVTPQVVGRSFGRWLARTLINPRLAER